MYLFEHLFSLLLGYIRVEFLEPNVIFLETLIFSMGEGGLVRSLGWQMQTFII